MAEDFASYTEKERAKREGKNSSKYRRLYTELLKEHSGVLQEAWKGATSGGSASSLDDSANDSDKLNNEYSQESKLIQEMWESERNAIGLGVVCGLAFFATIRFLPKFFIRHVGGEQKMAEVRKADEEAKIAGSYIYQRAFAWIVEGTFSFWVGNRAYQYQSQNSDGAYETLVKIPLCGGRSIIADNVCHQWVDITAHQIPRPFWKNLDGNFKEVVGSGLADEQAWKSILSFSNNCIKRGAYERKVKEDQGLPSKDSEHISLPTDVPDDTVLSKSEAEQLIGDSKL